LDCSAIEEEEEEEEEDEEEEEEAVEKPQLTAQSDCA